jgi:hypothetical protein
MTFQKGNTLAKGRRKRGHDVQPILVTRSTARKMLDGMSITQIARLERAGVLDVIRLNPKSPVTQVYYRYAQVLSLANGPTVSRDTADDTEVVANRHAR